MKDNRQSMYVSLLTIVLTIAINAAGVIYGAGKIAESLNVIQQRVDRLENSTKDKVDKSEFNEMKQDIKDIRNYLLQEARSRQK